MEFSETGIEWRVGEIASDERDGEEETDEDDTHERNANKCGVLNVVSI